jgi:hypothetical protein
MTRPFQQDFTGAGEELIMAEREVDEEKNGQKRVWGGAPRLSRTAKVS